MKIIAWVDESNANILESLNSLSVTEMDFDGENVMIAIDVTPSTAGAIAHGLVQNFNAYSVDIITEADYDDIYAKVADNLMKIMGD